MADKQQDIVLKIYVRERSSTNFLGGTVDIRLEHLRLKRELRDLRAVDASREIAISGLRRGPEAEYKVFVTRADPWMQQIKVVSIPSSGAATLSFEFDKESKPEKPEPPGQFIVRGRVTTADGQAAPGRKVEAIHQAVREEDRRLGAANTSADGSYQISYNPKVGPRPADPVNLLVRVEIEDENLIESPVRFNARSEETIDLVLSLLGPSEYERLVADLVDLPGDLSLLDYLPDEALFLAGQLGVDANLVTFVLASEHLAAKTQLQGAVFYGLFRQGLPNNLSLLLAQPAAVQRQALAAADPS